MVLENFTEVALKDCKTVLTLIKTRLPRSSMMHNVLQLSIISNTKQTAKIDTPTINISAFNGDLNSESAFIMASINVKGLPQNLIVLSPPFFPTDTMLESLSNAINWSQPNQFEAIENTVVDSLVSFGKQQGKIFEHDPIELYYLPAAVAENLLPYYSDDVTVKQLTTSDALQANSRWPAACKGSLEILSSSINFVGSAGVYLKKELLEGEDSQLVSWAIALPFGSIHALYTEPNHQRKGYALLTMTAVSKIVAEQNRIPVVQIYKSNDTSKSVNEKVGYIYSHDISLIHYHPIA